MFYTSDKFIGVFGKRRSSLGEFSGPRDIVVNWDLIIKCVVLFLVLCNYFCCSFCYAFYVIVLLCP